MCYSVAFSTTSEEDFEMHGPFYYIAPIAENERESEVLGYPNRWYVGCRYGGCSCHFWHTDQYTAVPTFKPLEHWQSEEDPEDVEATTAFFDLVARVVTEGHRIDVMDMSQDMMPQYVMTLPVSLGAVPREMLRFYNGWRFDFMA
jgi:hypothetical protein